MRVFQWRCVGNGGVGGGCSDKLVLVVMFGRLNDIQKKQRCNVTILVVAVVIVALVVLV